MEQNWSSHLGRADATGAGVGTGPGIVEVRSVVGAEGLGGVDEGSTRVVPWGGTHCVRVSVFLLYHSRGRIQNCLGIGLEDYLPWSECRIW